MDSGLFLRAFIIRFVILKKYFFTFADGTTFFMN